MLTGGTGPWWHSRKKGSGEGLASRTLVTASELDTCTSGSAWDLLSLAGLSPYAALPWAALPSCPHHRHSEFTGASAAPGPPPGGQGTNWVPSMPEWEGLEEPQLPNTPAALFLSYSIWR